VGTDGLLNYGGYADEQIDALLEQFVSSRGDAADDLYARIAQQAPIIPILFEDTTIYTHRGQVRGIAPLPGNIYNDISNWVIQ